MNDFIEKRDAVEALTAENTKLKASNKEIMTKTQRALMAQIGGNTILKTTLEKAEKDLAGMAKKVKALEKAAKAVKECCAKADTATCTDEAAAKKAAE